MALTTKQRLFIEHYCATWNASEAGRKVNPKAKRPDQIGYDYLRNPEIQAEIEARIAAIMPKGEIIARMAARGRASIADVLRMPEPRKRADGTEYTVVDDWALDLLKAAETGGIHQIKKIKETKYGTEVEVYDPLPALELLAKHAGLLKDDGGILKYLDLSKLTPAQLQRLADGDDPLAVLLDTTADPGESAA
jgi:phage terminase small subunit